MILQEVPFINQSTVFRKCCQLSESKLRSLFESWKEKKSPDKICKDNNILAKIGNQPMVFARNIDAVEILYKEFETEKKITVPKKKALHINYFLLKNAIQRGNLELVQYIISENDLSNIALFNGSKNTVMHYAFYSDPKVPLETRKNIVKYLLENGFQSNMMVTNDVGEVPLVSCKMNTAIPELERQELQQYGEDMLVWISSKATSISPNTLSLEY